MQLYERVNPSRTGGGKVGKGIAPSQSPTCRALMLTDKVLAKQAGMSLRGYQQARRAQEAEQREAWAAEEARRIKAEEEQREIAALSIPYDERYELRARREHGKLFWRAVCRNSGHTVGEVHQSTFPALVTADLTSILHENGEAQ